PLERIGCQCSERSQTRAHVLQECELYEQRRGVLREASAWLSRPEILGAEEGLQALAKFLETSGAFTETGRPRRETEPLVLSDDDEDEEEDRGSEGGEGKGEE
ncbi:hypothetical protein B0H14DRAFT_2191574, partial [Mycena olivaceomarginata]